MILKPLEPVSLVELFPPLSRELLLVLRSFQPSDWGLPTVCSAWTVKDVAAHLLGCSLGRLWKRDEPITTSGHPPISYQQLVSLINRENETWVQAAKRISPEMLIEFLELTDRRLYDHFRNLDPQGTAGISVAWASEDLAPNWLDIAREYTEKWLHQQHIREAVNKPLLTDPIWLSPVLEVFMYALPRAFRDEHAEDGTRVSVEIMGEAGGEWTLVRAGAEWQLYKGLDPHAVSSVQLDQDLAWRLFTKGLAREDARQQVRIEGNKALGERVLDMVSIMA